MFHVQRPLPLTTLQMVIWEPHWPPKENASAMQDDALANLRVTLTGSQ